MPALADGGTNFTVSTDYASFTSRALSAINASKINAAMYVWDRSPSIGQSANTKVLTINLLDSLGMLIPVINADEPFLFQVIVSAAQITANDFHCTYWDVHTGNWSRRGVLLMDTSVDSNGDVIATCGSNHLTDFAGILDVTIDVITNAMHPISGSGSDLFAIGSSSNSADFSANNVALVTVAIVLALTVVAAACAFYKKAAIAKDIEVLRLAHVVLFGKLEPAIENEHVLLSSELLHNQLRATKSRFMTDAFVRMQVRVPKHVACEITRPVSVFRCTLIGVAACQVAKHQIPVSIVSMDFSLLGFAYESCVACCIVSVPE